MADPRGLAKVLRAAWEHAGFPDDSPEAERCAYIGTYTYDGTIDSSDLAECAELLRLPGIPDAWYTAAGLVSDRGLEMNVTMKDSLDAIALHAQMIAVLCRGRNPLPISCDKVAPLADDVPRLVAELRALRAERAALARVVDLAALVAAEPGPHDTSAVRVGACVLAHGLSDGDARACAAELRAELAAALAPTARVVAAARSVARVYGAGGLAEEACVEALYAALAAPDTTRDGAQ